MAGKVIAVIRVYPKELTENFEPLLNKVQNAIRNSVYELVKWEATDIAFGYKALDIYFLMPEDIERGTEELEELVKSIDEVDNIDVIYVTRIGA
ncbi:MAG: elongation factor 1-beta [Ignisphaera sp.]|nr:elongation factor 1-beta [Ignisphaera sp.]MCX8168019.1 elongation factor 1-beta [Ignisphaera sp.]